MMKMFASFLLFSGIVVAMYPIHAAAKDTPVAPSTGHIENSWRPFAPGEKITVNIHKYYGYVGNHWKIKIYKYAIQEASRIEELKQAKLDEKKLIDEYSEKITKKYNIQDQVTFTHQFSFQQQGLYAFRSYLCEENPASKKALCVPSANVQVVQVGGSKIGSSSLSVDTNKTDTKSKAPAPSGNTSPKPMTNAQYAALEKKNRSKQLLAAISRIQTLPVSKHIKIRGKDAGPNLKLHLANVNRVKKIFSQQFTTLQSAQKKRKITDFDTSRLGKISNFDKGKLAWQWLFPMANGHIKQFPASYKKNVAEGQYPYTYTNFLKAIAKYPRFCGDHASVDGDSADTLCKLSLAMMFAHFAQEVGGHLGKPDTHYTLPFSDTLATPSGQIGSGGAMKVFHCTKLPGQQTNWCKGFKGGVNMENQRIPEYRQALYWVNESGCSEGGAGCEYRSCDPGTWQAQAWPCPANTKYFGRGPKQLSYNYNYGPFSRVVFNNVNVLLKNPEKVTEGWLAFTSAVYFFMQPRPPKPSMYELIYRYWKPNKAARSAGLGRNMGTSIMIINGGIECGGSKAIAQADNRVKYYSGFLDFFGMSNRIHQKKRTSGQYNCKGAKQFSADHGANYLNSWAKDWQGTCKLVAWETAYSGYIDGSFKQCYEKEILKR